jgi:hypothetical protein
VRLLLGASRPDALKKPRRGFFSAHTGAGRRFSS